MTARSNMPYHTLPKMGRLFEIAQFWKISGPTRLTRFVAGLETCWEPGVEVESLPPLSNPRSSPFGTPHCDRLLTRSCRAAWRGNSLHSCRAKASFTVAGGLPEVVAPGLGKIQSHIVHPQAAKLLFSSQTSSLAMGHSLPHVCEIG